MLAVLSANNQPINPDNEIEEITFRILSMIYAFKRLTHNASLKEKYLYPLYSSQEKNVIHSTVIHNTSTSADVQKLPSYDYSGEHRRTSVERRSDIRAPSDRKVSLVQRIKMYIKQRIRVDRRKKVTKQTMIVESLLTPEEIEALIK